MRAATLPLALALAACVGGGDDAPLNPAALPANVTTNLPVGIDIRAVGLQGGCYIYDTPEGDVRFVTDDAGTRVCIR